MNYGGPVWHASAKSFDGTRLTSQLMARNALAGVGDARLGEWLEVVPGGAVHIRRRLSAAEASRVNPLRDIRGTPEQRQRLARLRRELPPRLQWYLDSVPT